MFILNTQLIGRRHTRTLMKKMGINALCRQCAIECRKMDA